MDFTNLLAAANEPSIKLDWRIKERLNSFDSTASDSSKSNYTHADLAEAIGSFILEIVLE